MRALKKARIADKIPLFPVVPLVPIALFLANALALRTLFRKVHRLEERAA